MTTLLNDETPGFAFIEVTSEDPFVLFNKWFEEVKQSDIVLPQTFTLATVSREGRPGSRSLIVRRQDADGFVFTTHRNGRKAQELNAVPSGAMVFNWVYLKNGVRVIQQVRVEGPVQEVNTQEVQVLFDNEPLYCKMRAHLCQQGSEVEWQQMQDSYIRLLEEVRGGRQLEMPQDFAGFKLTADVMEFYYGSGNLIADRLVFTKRNNAWSHLRVAT